MEADLVFECIRRVFLGELPVVEVVVENVPGVREMRNIVKALCLNGSALLSSLR